MTEEEFRKREKVAMIFVEVCALVIGAIIVYILFT